VLGARGTEGLSLGKNLKASLLLEDTAMVGKRTASFGRMERYEQTATTRKIVKGGIEGSDKDSLLCRHKFGKGKWIQRRQTSAIRSWSYRREDFKLPANTVGDQHFNFYQYFRPGADRGKNKEARISAKGTQEHGLIIGGCDASTFGNEIRKVHEAKSRRCVWGVGSK